MFGMCCMVSRKLVMFVGVFLWCGMSLIVLNSLRLGGMFGVYVVGIFMLRFCCSVVLLNGVLVSFGIVCDSGVFVLSMLDLIICVVSSFVIDCVIDVYVCGWLGWKLLK